MPIRGTAVYVVSQPTNSSSKSARTDGVFVKHQLNLSERKEDPTISKPTCVQVDPVDNTEKRGAPQICDQSTTRWDSVREPRLRQVRSAGPTVGPGHS